MTIVVFGVIGYGIGVFAASNIILPLLYSWPKARRLQREGRLRRQIPVAYFVVAPLAWSALVLASIWIAWRVSPENIGWYLFGLLASTFQVGKLVFRPNADMEADFADTFGEYLAETEIQGMSTDRLPFFAEHAPGSVGERLLRVAYGSAQITNIASNGSTDPQLAVKTLKAIPEMLAALYLDLAALDAALPASVIGMNAPDVVIEQEGMDDNARGQARVRLVRQAYANYRAQAGVE